MPLQIVKNDITKMGCDAIVNAANNSLLGGGGVDGAIHRAAGSKLLEECKTLGGCKTGEAKITGGYKLPSKYVIHTVGPVWHGGQNREKELLVSCYKNSLILAQKYNCKTVAFPLISAGVYGYPVSDAFQIAVDTIADFLNSFDDDMTVFIVVYDNNSICAIHNKFENVKEYIDNNFIDRSCVFESPGPAFEIPAMESCRMAPSVFYEETVEDIEDVINHTLDESFSEMLLRLIDEKGMKDSECYKKANIDKRLFSKIRSNKNYKPSKSTVLAFCIALELDIKTADELLMKAGFALSHSNKFDIIVEYFILNKNYNIFEINEALFAFDQTLLGSI